MCCLSQSQPTGVMRVPGPHHILHHLPKMDGEVGMALVLVWSTSVVVWTITQGLMLVEWSDVPVLVGAAPA
jgi:hypothetical protein